MYGWIFALIIATNVIINLDHGIIPAASLQIEESLSLSDEELGYLGSLVYLGIVTIGLFGGRIFLTFKAKYVMIFSYLGMIIALTIFTQTFSQSWPYYISRYLTGAAQAPMLIYYPVWVDNFGGSHRTLWLTALQGVIPFGIFLGYVLSSIVTAQWGWHVSFYSQVGLLIPCFLLFLFVPFRNFEIKRQQRFMENRTLSIEDNVSIMSGQHNYFSMMKELLTIKLWLCTTVTISVLYFMVTGIQFWMTNYMIQVLNQDKVLVNTVFSIVSITSPVLGCLFGGFVTQYLGGYDKPEALYACVGYSLIGTLSGLPIPFLNSFWPVVALIWVQLFFGGSMVPPVTGIMLTAVPQKLRAFANSNTTTIYNLFGFLPAPSVYGFMLRFGDRAGLIFINSISFVGLIFLFWAVLIKRRESGKTIDEFQSASQIFEEPSNITERVLQFNEIPLNISLTLAIGSLDREQRDDDHD
ncbi:hypothetical protein pb186bvf_000635 [Paramecium bursaria]